MQVTVTSGGLSTLVDTCKITPKTGISYIKLIDITSPDKSPKLKHLMEYNYFDFTDTSNDYVGEVFQGEGFNLLKIAISKTVASMNLSYSGFSMLQISPNTARDAAFDCVLSIYEVTDPNIEISQLELLIHKTNYSEPHSDQVVNQYFNVTSGSIMKDLLSREFTRRYNGCVFNNYMIMEDGSKYWLGHFTDTIEGV